MPLCGMQAPPCLHAGLNVIGNDAAWANVALGGEN